MADFDASMMTIAWRDFLDFAVGHEPARLAFTAETGLSFPSPARTPLDAAIDKATGVHESVVRDFAYWATINQWGEEGVPAEFLSEARARFPTQGPLT